MSVALLIAQLREQRECWLTLRKATDDQHELAVRLRRPSEAELPDYRPSADKPTHKLLADAACNAVVGWRGFTSADLVGAGIGSADPLEFSAELWAEVVRDRSDWLNACSARLMELINEHLKARSEQRKN